MGKLMITSVTITPQTKWEDLTPKQMEIAQGGSETLMMMVLSAALLFEKDNIEGVDLDPEKGKVHTLETQDNATVEQWLTMKTIDPKSQEDIQEFKVQGKDEASGEYSSMILQNDIDYDINGDGVMDKVMAVGTYVGNDQTPAKLMKIYLNNEMQTLTIIEEDFQA